MTSRRDLTLLKHTDGRMWFDPKWTYTQEPLRPFGGYFDKPKGLWFSVQGEDDWYSWCTSEEFRLNGLRTTQRLRLKPSARVRYLPTLAAMYHFWREYGYTWDWAGTALEGKGHENYGIDWNRVVVDYDAIIIAPYHWPLRMKADWYYTWDCASGCVWNLDAVESFYPVDGMLDCIQKVIDAKAELALARIDRLHAYYERRDDARRTGAL